MSTIVPTEMRGFGTPCRLVFRKETWSGRGDVQSKQILRKETAVQERAPPIDKRTLTLGVPASIKEHFRGSGHLTTAARSSRRQTEDPADPSNSYSGSPGKPNRSESAGLLVILEKRPCSYLQRGLLRSRASTESDRASEFPQNHLELVVHGGGRVRYLDSHE